MDHEDIRKFNEKELEEKRKLLKTNYFKKQGGFSQASTDPNAMQSVRVESSLVRSPEIWNDQKERDYLNRKAQSKKDLCDIVKSVKYTDCGFSHSIQKVLNNDQVKDMRVEFSK